MFVLAKDSQDTTFEKPLLFLLICGVNVFSFQRLNVQKALNLLQQPFGSECLMVALPHSRCVYADCLFSTLECILVLPQVLLSER